MSARLRGGVTAWLACVSALGSGMVVVACTGTMTDGDGPGRDGGGGPAGDAGVGGEEAGPVESDAGLVSADDGGSAPDAAFPPDAGEAGEARVGVFVAQGHAGRTTISCDDGRSWIHDRSLDDSIVCFSDGFDCDHHPGSAKGVTYGRGWFFATYGWGPPGSVQRSRDGVTWEPVLEETTFGGIAFGQERVLAGARQPRWTADDGESWTDSGSTELDVWNVRRTGWVPHDGGRFVLVGEDGGARDVVLSSDGGETWWHPSSLPAECGAAIQNEGGIAYGDGTMLIVGRTGDACRSTDGGATWTSTAIGGEVHSHLVWSGDAFLAWERGVLWRSEDGAAWSSTPTSPADLRIGAVAMSPGGTFVAVKGGWQEWYDRQRFYRSEDGVTWTELPSGSYVGSHPIRDIEFGYVESCP